MEEILATKDIHAGYQGGSVLEGVSLSVEESQIVSLLGRNGVGKTTLLKTIVGILGVQSGEILYKGEDITGAPIHEIYDKGITLVPEDRQVFPDLTVEENLRVPITNSDSPDWDFERLFDLFPNLRERLEDKGGHLSGGEKQMLSIARALRSDPELLILDEPTEGLAPKVVEDIKPVIKILAESGITILLVEQNVKLALNIASYQYIMDNGLIVFEGDVEKVRQSEDLMERYLGVGDE